MQVIDRIFFTNHARERMKEIRLPVRKAIDFINDAKDLGNQKRNVRTNGRKTEEGEYYMDYYFGPYIFVTLKKKKETLVITVYDKRLKLKDLKSL